MKRRDYLENVSAVATSPLVLPYVSEAAENLRKGGENQSWDKLDTGHRIVHKRGVEDEILVYVDKFDEVDEPKLTVRNTYTGEVVDYIHIYEEYPEPYIGESLSVVYTILSDEKFTVSVPYYDEIKYGERGWISVDNNI